MAESLTEQMDLFRKKDDITPVDVMPQDLTAEPLPDPYTPEMQETRKQMSMVGLDVAPVVGDIKGMVELPEDVQLIKDLVSEGYEEQDFKKMGLGTLFGAAVGLGFLPVVGAAGDIGKKAIKQSVKKESIPEFRQKQIDAVKKKYATSAERRKALKEINRPIPKVFHGAARLGEIQPSLSFDDFMQESKAKNIASATIKEPLIKIGKVEENAFLGSDKIVVSPAELAKINDKVLFGIPEINYTKDSVFSDIHEIKVKQVEGELQFIDTDTGETIKTISKKQNPSFYSKEGNIDVVRLVSDLNSIVQNNATEKYNKYNLDFPSDFRDAEKLEQKGFDPYRAKSVRGELREEFQGAEGYAQVKTTGQHSELRDFALSTSRDPLVSMKPSFGFNTLENVVYMDLPESSVRRLTPKEYDEIVTYGRTLDSYPLEPNQIGYALPSSSHKEAEMAIVLPEEFGPVTALSKGTPEVVEGLEKNTKGTGKLSLADKVKEGQKVANSVITYAAVLKKLGQPQTEMMGLKVDAPTVDPEIGYKAIRGMLTNLQSLGKYTEQYGARGTYDDILTSQLSNITTRQGIENIAKSLPDGARKNRVETLSALLKHLDDVGAGFEVDAEYTARMGTKNISDAEIIDHFVDQKKMSKKLSNLGFSVDASGNRNIENLDNIGYRDIKRLMFLLTDRMSEGGLVMAKGGAVPMKEQMSAFEKFRKTYPVTEEMIEAMKNLTEEERQKIIDQAIADRQEGERSQEPTQENIKEKIKDIRRFYNEGGVAKQMSMFEDGGLLDEGGTVDPVSGNDVPPGSTQEEVRDDIPAQLSEGEFVFPADVVRYWGLDTLMRMRQEAKMGLQMMEQMGQMGNADEATIPDDVPFDINDLDMEDEEEYNYQVGGFVPGTAQQQQFGIAGYQAPVMQQTGVAQIPQQQYTPPPVPQAPVPQMQPFSRPQQQAVPTMQVPEQLPTFQQAVTPPTETAPENREYINPETGERRTFTFINNQPTTEIPAGFIPISQYTPAEIPTLPTTTTLGTTSVISDSQSQEDQAENERLQNLYNQIDTRIDAAKRLGYSEFASPIAGLATAMIPGSSILGLNSKNLKAGTITGTGYTSDGVGGLIDPVTGGQVNTNIIRGVIDNFTYRDDDGGTYGLKQVAARAKAAESEQGQLIQKQIAQSKVKDKYDALVKEAENEADVNYINTVRAEVESAINAGLVDVDGRITNPYEAARQFKLEQARKGVRTAQDDIEPAKDLPRARVTATSTKQEPDIKVKEDPRLAADIKRARQNREMQQQIAEAERREQERQNEQAERESAMSNLGEDTTSGLGGTAEELASSYFEKGGLASKKKPKPKRMKRGGLASKK